MKNLTALGKLFRTTVISSLLAASVATAAPSANDSVTGPFDPGTSWFTFITNALSYRGGLLDSHDKGIYMQSLVIMLENVPLGKTMEWRSDMNPGVYGHMRVVYGYQTSNGYCRVYQSEVYNDGNAKSWQEYACRSEDQPQWKFYNK